jgi:hypothetical protein
MALWELEELQPPVLLGFIRNLLPPPVYRAQEFLPAVTVDDIEFEYIKGASQLPVMATIISWDSEAPIGSKYRTGERVQGEIPAMKRKERISEKEIIRFLNPRRGTADQQTAVRAVYDIAARLTLSTLATVEWLGMQALSEDKLIYNEDGVIFQFDFGIDNRQQINLLTGVDGAGTDRTPPFGPAWLNPDGTPNAAATPVTDLMVLCDEVEQRTGRRPARMVASKKAINSLLYSTQIKGYAYAQNAPDRPLTPGEVSDVLNRYGLPTFSPYDAVMEKENPDGTRTQVRAMAENKAFLLPSTNVGNQLWGPTAEARLQLPQNYSQLRNGLWANTYGKDEPPSEWVKTAAVTFPTMPDVQYLAQMQLW